LPGAVLDGIKADAQARTARAAAVRDERARERMLVLLTDAFVELATFRAGREASSPGTGETEVQMRCVRLAGRLGHAIVDQIERVLESPHR
jgi:hypothetical protein